MGFLMMMMMMLKTVIMKSTDRYDIVRDTGDGVPDDDGDDDDVEDCDNEEYR